MICVGFDNGRFSLNWHWQCEISWGFPATRLFWLAPLTGWQHYYATHDRNSHPTLVAFYFAIFVWVFIISFIYIYIYMYTYILYIYTVYIYIISQARSHKKPVTRSNFRILQAPSIPKHPKPNIPSGLYHLVMTNIAMERSTHF